MRERLLRFGPYVAVTGLFALNIYAVCRTKNFTSDDVAPLVMLEQWLNGHHGSAYFGSDTFIGKFPWYTAIHWLLPNSRFALTVSIVVFAVAGFGLAAWSIAYFLRRAAAFKRRPFLASLAWLATLGYPVGLMLANPHTRNLEIGLWLGLLAACDVLRRRAGAWSTRRQVTAWAALGFMWGSLFFHDPYWLVIGFMPFTVVGVYWFLTDGLTWNRLMGAVMTVAAVATYKAFAAAAQAGRVYADTGKLQLITGDTLVAHLQATAQAWLGSFGLQPFGVAVEATTLPELAGGFAIFGLAAAMAVRASRATQLRRAPWLAGFAFVGWWSLCMVTISSYVALPYDDGLVRYVITWPFLAVLWLNLAYRMAPNQRWRSAWWLVIFVAIGANLGQLAASLQQPAANNGEERAVIATLNRLGVHKGYAEYWDANISTYLSRGKQTVIAAQCRGHELIAYRWLRDTAAETKPASQSYLWIDASGPKLCAADDLASQLGEPARVVQATQRSTLLLYDYDITKHLSSRQ